MPPPPYVRLDTPARSDPGGPGGFPSRWAFPPSAPEWVVTCDSPTRAVLRTPDGVEQEWDDPLGGLGR